MATEISRLKAQGQGSWAEISGVQELTMAAGGEEYPASQCFPRPCYYQYARGLLWLTLDYQAPTTIQKAGEVPKPGSRKVGHKQWSKNTRTSEEPRC